jgi:N-acetylglucosaminyldiphosphoundecaprenol N-acetyl-beta-D-mannosaminyltransferase
VLLEASFTLGLLAASPLLEKPDLMIVVSPSLPALSAAITISRARGIPWVLWLQDMVADAAFTTQLVRSRRILSLAGRLEAAAYRSAARIVVVSDAFRAKLKDGGVPEEKIITVYNPATLPEHDSPQLTNGDMRVINIGNIGRSQGLPRLIRAFEESAKLRALGAKLVITGGGGTSEEVREAITTTDNRVEFLGMLPREGLMGEIDRASVGIVSHRPGLVEFNLPSKLNNYMARGLPVLASVDPESEVAQIVRDSGAGWVTDPDDLDAFCDTLARVLADRAGRARASSAGLRFAQRALRPSAFASRFEEIALGIAVQTSDNVTEPTRAPQRVDVLGVGISVTSMEDAVKTIGSWIENGERKYVCCTPVYGVMQSQDDEAVRRAHEDSGLTVPDGMPMVWAGRFAGAREISRVYGPDLMERVCAVASKRGWGCFLYGGAPGVPEELGDRLTERFPGLRIVGTYSPPFRPLTATESDEVMGMINASGAELVWVGMSTPKQDLWMAENVNRLESPAVLIGVGAGFDIHSGHARRPPKWMGPLGLFWLFRLLQEPRRLWRRYLLGNLRFLGAIIRRRPYLRDDTPTYVSQRADASEPPGSVSVGSSAVDDSRRGPEQQAQVLP